MKRLAAILILTGTLALPLQGMAVDRNIYPGPYQAEIIRVIDGDTIEARIPTWPGAAHVASIRVDGVDTPEMRSKCRTPAARVREKKLAKEARQFVIKFVSEGAVLRNVRLGKYAGRVVAEVEDRRGNSLIDALLKAKSSLGGALAHFYDGGKRRGWCGGD